MWKLVQEKWKISKNLSGSLCHFFNCKAPDCHASKYLLNDAESKCYYFSLSYLYALSGSLQRLVKWSIHLNEILPGNKNISGTWILIETWDVSGLHLSGSSNFPSFSLVSCEACWSLEHRALYWDKQLGNIILFLLLF